MASTAVIVGLGPGFGEAFAWKLAREGYRVVVCSRTREYLETFAEDLRDAGHRALAVPMDITDPAQVSDGFDRIREEFGPVSLLSIQASNERGWERIRDLSHEEFTAAWEVYAFGSFLCAKQVIDEMAESGGTILFVGASRAMGRGEAHGYASASEARRGLARSLARELWPEGIHVAHVSISGPILNPDVYDETEAPITEAEYIDPEAAVESCWHLVQQDSGAWSFDLDVRPRVNGI